MFKILNRPISSPELHISSLYDETTFYESFMRDLRRCRDEVIIESPFITSKRMSMLLPVLEKLKSRHVRVIVNTRDPETHDSPNMRSDAHRAVSQLQHMGIHVLFTVGHHRKLAIIDREILYEGSLNILSQNNSCEIMRKIVSTQLAWQMVRFVKVDQFIR
jgi:phosphatidylserine/phosphatidylglycerophosphate/cardiolipin synthase-like enzyme